LRLYYYAFILTWVILSSCGSYRHNILFQVSNPAIHQQWTEAETNYLIRSNDLLTLQLYTNGGERIVDPNRESFSGDGNQESPAGSAAPQYLVGVNGLVKFPLIGELKMEGLTIREAEQLLAKAYEKFYQEAYAVLKVNNKRVILLGAPGGQVIPLDQENMRLTEVLALAKGISSEARANNIRVIRQDKVFVADLSTFEGYQKNNVLMESGDIVYVEPVRRPFIEALRDYSPVITIVTSLATLIFIISQVN
jgi:polysaccharide export outer membrane protein